MKCSEGDVDKCFPAAYRLVENAVTCTDAQAIEAPWHAPSSRDHILGWTGHWTVLTWSWTGLSGCVQHRFGIEDPGQLQL